MSGEVIKSFLVGLGFSIDEAGLSKFNKSILSAAARVTALYGSIKLSTAGIFYGITKISQGFEDLGYSLRLVAPAANKMLILRQAMLDAYRHAGVDLVKVVQQSILFNYSLAKTKFALEAVYKSVGAKFLPMLTRQMDVFRAKIFQNMPKIQAQLEKFITFIFRAFEGTVELGTRIWSILSRVWDFFDRLDQVTGGWSTKVIGLIAAWKLLNLSFIRTPLGMILTGLLAILAIYDDFKVWKEGGESFFNWGKTSTWIIAGLVSVLGALPTVMYVVTAAIKGWTIAMGAFQAIATVARFAMLAFREAVFLFEAGTPFGWIAIAVTGLVLLLTHLKQVREWFSKGLDAAGKFFESHAGFTPYGANVPGSSPNNPAPLTSNTSNSSANNRFNQENNVIIQASPNAHETGKAVAGELSRVTFDMVSNSKGAAR